MNDNQQPILSNWGFLGRIVLKATVLFVLCNVSFALWQPLEELGRLSLYNWVLPGRLRLPYGEEARESYNLSLNNVPALFASHILNHPKPADEFRVLLLGDSGTWGWLLSNEQTLAAQLNNLATTESQPIVVYNLGYPIMSVTKDLLLLEEGLKHEPDLVVWLVTLESFAREQQLAHPLLQHNAPRVQRLINLYELQLSLTDSRLIIPSFWEQTVVGQRRALADLLRLQLYGFSWAATEIDQQLPTEMVLRQSDFDENLSWHGWQLSATLAEEMVAWEVVPASIKLAAPTPILIINEPIFISDGQNSQLRYNSLYPRWAYDQYRQQLLTQAQTNNWNYLDLWNAIPATEFTDNPVHLTPTGARLLAEQLKEAIWQMESR